MTDVAGDESFHSDKKIKFSAVLVVFIFALAWILLSTLIGMVASYLLDNEIFYLLASVALTLVLALSVMYFFPRPNRKSIISLIEFSVMMILNVTALGYAAFTMGDFKAREELYDKAQHLGRVAYMECGPCISVHGGTYSIANDQQRYKVQVDKLVVRAKNYGLELTPEGDSESWDYVISVTRQVYDRLQMQRD